MFLLFLFKEVMNIIEPKKMIECHEWYGMWCYDKLLHLYSFPIACFCLKECDRRDRLLVLYRDMEFLDLLQSIAHVKNPQSNI